MNAAELEQLEREVEQARSRVATDLARLRAPGVMSELKEDVAAQVSRSKDQLLGGAKDAARDRADGFLSEVKARITANPGAALSVAAGLAWRLYRHPPVATVLIGAGIMGLMRADPRNPSMGSEAAARAAELAGSATAKVQAKAEEWRESDMPGQIGERADEARQRLGSLAETAGERIGAVADAAREQVEEWKSAVRGSGGKGASRYVGQARSWPAATHGAAQRDRYLLGAAALAMAAAVGVAAQRRFTEQDRAGEVDVESRRVPVPVRAYEKASAAD